MSPRAYQMGDRKTAVDQNRRRILDSARNLLLSEDFAEFTMDAVARRAGVTRLTVYYQFESKTGLLEALYNSLAKRGGIEQLAEVFSSGGDPIRTLHRFIEVFAGFWDSDRFVIRRLHALGAIDSEIGEGLRARNERRRQGARVIVDRYCRMYPPLMERDIPIAVDTLYMLTSFESYDALAGNERTRRQVIEMIRPLAHRAIGFTPRFVSPH